MDDSSRSDIRKLLKMFGIQADEAIIAHLARNPGVGPLHVQMQLTDLTDYDATPPDQPLSLIVEGTVRPSNSE